MPPAQRPAAAPGAARPQTRPSQLPPRPRREGGSGGRNYGGGWPCRAALPGSPGSCPHPRQGGREMPRASPRQSPRRQGKKGSLEGAGGAERERERERPGTDSRGHTQHFSIKPDSFCQMSEDCPRGTGHPPLRTRPRPPRTRPAGRQERGSEESREDSNTVPTRAYQAGPRRHSMSQHVKVPPNAILGRAPAGCCSRPVLYLYASNSIILLILKIY